MPFQYVHSKTWGAPNGRPYLEIIAKHQDANFDIYNKLNG